MDDDKNNGGDADDDGKGGHVSGAGDGGGGKTGGGKGDDGGDGDDSGDDDGDAGAGPDGGRVRTGPESSDSLKYSQEVTSPDEEPEREGRSLVTTHHEVIKEWAEARDGTHAEPAHKPDTRGTLGVQRGHGARAPDRPTINTTGTGDLDRRER